MKLTEHIALIYRANKYKNKSDKGGIAYLLSSVKEGHTAFDIGAHKAGYLYFFQKQVGPSGKVFAFEPQSELYNYVSKIKLLLNWQNVTLEHLAVSDAEEKVTLYIPSNKKSNASSPGATLVQNFSRTDIGSTEEVATETLDAYCKRHSVRPDFLKIDVEGNELRIFKGGLETLKNHKPKILVEIEARHVGKEKVLETFKYLEAFGYTGYFIHGSKNIPLSSFNFEKYQNVDNPKNYCNNFIFE